MSGGFQDVTLGWKGQDYILPAERQMPVIAKIEAALCPDGRGQPVQKLLSGKGLTYHQLASAYGLALRAAGARVTDEEVYLSIMGDLAEGDAGAAQKMQLACLGLLEIVAPPVALKLRRSSADAEGASGNG